MTDLFMTENGYVICGDHLRNNWGPVFVHVLSPAERREIIRSGETPECQDCRDEAAELRDIVS